MHPLHLSFFGTFSIQLQEQQLENFATDKVRALLVYLAVESGQEHERSRLAGLFWPEVSEKQARQSLRAALYRLRQSLDQAGAALDLPFRASEQLLTISHQSVTLQSANPPLRFSCDVDQFRAILAAIETHLHDSLADCTLCTAQLEQAAALYRGELLEGFGLADAPAFEEWLLLQREMLHQQALLTFGRLTNIYTEQGVYEQAAAIAARLLSFDPYRETSQRVVMRLLALRGLPDQALAQFAACRQLLMEEFGAEPEAETVALAEQIRRGELQSNKVVEVQGSKVTEAPTSLSPPPHHRVIPSHSQHDWREMPAGAPFFGRQNEVSELTTWFVDSRCSVVSILAIGGMGKTSLAAHVTSAVAEHFDLVIWRSLLNAPPLNELINTILPVLSNQQESTLPRHVDHQLTLYFDYMQEQRVLLVLDNMESILQADTAGRYRAGYEQYGQLLHGMVSRQHQGQLLITSRERPAGARQLERDSSRVRSLSLAGLDEAAGHQLLASRGLSGTTEDEAALTDRYSGNPLALKLVADTVQDIFFGDLGEFLAEDSLIFDDVRRVLDQQFARLTTLEQQILFWLAIERVPIDMPTLRGLLSPSPVGRALIEALNSLQRRSLIERQPHGFTLQNVVTEFLTERLVEEAIRELTVGEFNFLHQLPLLKAQSKEYIRQSQRRLLLEPVAHSLSALHNHESLREMMQAMLDELRSDEAAFAGYAGGNLLNLTLLLGLDPTDLDFSQLSLWQVYAQDADLRAVDLRKSDLSGSQFTQTFTILSKLTFHPTSPVLATAGTDEIRLWDANSAQPLGTLIGPQKYIWSIVYAPDGRYLACGGEDGAIWLWDFQANPQSPARRVLFQSEFQVRFVCFSADGALFAAVIDDDKIRIWRTHDFALLALLQASDGINTAIAFSPNGRFLVACSHSVRLWDIEYLHNIAHADVPPEHPESQGEKRGEKRGELFWQVPIEESAIWSLAFSTDGKFLAGGGDFGSAFIWDMQHYERSREQRRGDENREQTGNDEAANREETQEPIQTIDAHSGRITAICFGRDSSTLVTGGRDHLVRSWDVGTGQIRKTLYGHTGSLTCIASRPNSELLASGATDGTLRMWNAADGEMIFRMAGRSLRFQSIACSPSGRRLATSTVDHHIQIWSLGERGDAAALERGNFVTHEQSIVGHSDNVWAVAFSPDGSLLASASEDQTICLWDVETGQCQATLQGHEALISSASFSRCGTTLASACLNGVVRLWSVETAECVGLMTKSPEAIITQHGIWSMAYSPDNTILATGLFNGSVILWDIAAQKIHRELPLYPDWARGLSFNKDGSILASCSNDGSISLWSLQFDREIAHWTGHEDWVRNIAFNADETALITSCYDGTVKLWPLPANLGQLEQFDPPTALTTLNGHTDAVSGIAVVPQQSFFITASYDETLRFWDSTTTECLHVARVSGPYEGMNITSVTGISKAQKVALKALGAVEK